MINQVLKDGSIVHYVTKNWPILLVNHDYRQYFYINSPRYLANSRIKRILAFVTRHHYIQFKIDPREMQDKILLIQMFDYSRGELVDSPGMIIQEI